LIPSDTLVVRPAGTLVALVDADSKVHFQPITVGRDFGDRIEVLSGLKLGQRVIVNPNDSVQEGVKVHPVSGK
jgi:multidrug efflux pump subunit AcrA (membrane-fusion protein)